MAQFRWIEWNTEHIARHGVTPEEAEWVATHPARGYPIKYRGGYTTRGQTRSGRWLQVAFTWDRAVGTRRMFVYHARSLTENEKRRLR